MKKKNKAPIKPKAESERQMAFDSLPPHVRNQLDEAEIELFLYAEMWPESLFNKLEEFILPHA